MKIWLNRLPSAFPRATESFRQAGFDAIALSILKAQPVDVSTHPIVINFDQFSDIVVTSPETSNWLVEAIKSRWVQWPEGQKIWAVGSTTAEIMISENCSVELADEVGSAALIARMRGSLSANQRVLVASSVGGGLQFDSLNDLLTIPVTHLELFELVSYNQLQIGDMNHMTAIVHGSATLLSEFLNQVSRVNANAAQVLHFVTSSDAQSQLPLGSRYYRIQLPTPKQVRLAIQGEPSVKN